MLTSVAQSWQGWFFLSALISPRTSLNLLIYKPFSWRACLSCNRLCWLLLPQLLTVQTLFDPYLSMTVCDSGSSPASLSSTVCKTCSFMLWANYIVVAFLFCDADQARKWAGGDAAVHEDQASIKWLLCLSGWFIWWWPVLPRAAWDSEWSFRWLETPPRLAAVVQYV